MASVISFVLHLLKKTSKYMMWGSVKHHFIFKQFVYQNYTATVW